MIYPQMRLLITQNKNYILGWMVTIYDNIIIKNRKKCLSQKKLDSVIFLDDVSLYELLCCIRNFAKKKFSPIFPSLIVCFAVSVSSLATFVEFVTKINPQIQLFLYAWGFYVIPQTFSMGNTSTNVLPFWDQIRYNTSTNS
ncbi:hypothetical protein ACJX0J_005589 [Zea mays]